MSLSSWRSPPPPTRQGPPDNVTLEQCASLLPTPTPLQGPHTAATGPQPLPVSENPMPISHPHTQFQETWAPPNYPPCSESANDCPKPGKREPNPSCYLWSHQDSSPALERRTPRAWAQPRRLHVHQTPQVIDHLHSGSSPLLGCPRVTSLICIFSRHPKSTGLKVSISPTQR